MNNPFFSIVITCHNYERYVGQAISSVKNQFFTSAELIVVDAESTDSSAEIISGFDNIISTKAPAGSTALACDQGFRLCSGEWIIFLDADDFLFPHALSTLAPLLHADYIKCQFNLSIANKDGVLLQDKMIRTPSFYNSEEISKSFFLTSTYIWPTTSGNTYHRHFINRLFPLPDSFFVDGVLNTIAPSFGRILHIDTPLGAYRIHGRNLHNRSGPQTSFSFLPQRIKRRYKEFFWSRKKALFCNKVFYKNYFLNSEIHFLSYRIICKKLNYDYCNSSRESIPFLLINLWLSVLPLFKNPFFCSSMLIWHFLFLLSPRFLAFYLLRLRYERF